MIEFKPIENTRLIKLIIENDIINTNNCFGYCASEDGSECGCCIFSVNGTYAEIIAVCSDKDKPYIAEGLVRSALNYAAGMNAYIALAYIEEYKALFEKMGFKYEKNQYKGEIPEILSGNCR